MKAAPRHATTSPARRPSTSGWTRCWRLTQDEAPFAGFGIDRFQGHAEAWGWDTTRPGVGGLLQPRWAAGRGAPVPGRLRLGAGRAALRRARLHRGDDDDATIRSHEMDVARGLDPDERLRHPQHRVPGRRPDARPLVERGGREGRPRGRHVDDLPRLPGRGGGGSPRARRSRRRSSWASDACRRVRPAAAGRARRRPEHRLLAQAGTLGAWEAMAVGTDRDAAGAATGRFVFAYVDPAQASRGPRRPDAARRPGHQPAHRAALRDERPPAHATRPPTARMLVLDVMPVEGAQPAPAAGAVRAGPAVRDLRLSGGYPARHGHRIAARRARARAQRQAPVARLGRALLQQRLCRPASTSSTTRSGTRPRCWTSRRCSRTG